MGLVRFARNGPTFFLMSKILPLNVLERIEKEIIASHIKNDYLDWKEIIDRLYTGQAVYQEMWSDGVKYYSKEMKQR